MNGLNQIVFTNESLPKKTQVIGMGRTSRVAWHARDRRVPALWMRDITRGRETRRGRLIRNF